MKRVVIGRFKCAECGLTCDVELEEPDERPPLPNGWCSLNGTWHEAGIKEEGKEASSVPLNIEVCTYECMAKFFLRNVLEDVYKLALRSNTQTLEVMNASHGE